METGPGRPTGLKAKKPFVLIFFSIVCLDAKYLLSDSGYRKTGCFTLAGGTHTLNLGSSTACSSGRCPQCFMMDTTYNNVILTISNCHQNVFTSTVGGSVLVNYQFVNVARRMASVFDGSSTYILPGAGAPGSAMECNCVSNLGAVSLACDASILNHHFTATYDNSAFTANTPCADVTGTPSLALNALACGTNQFCPQCFRLDTSSAVVTLTITYCSYYHGTDYSSSAVLDYTFSNTGSNLGYVSDNVNKYTLNKYGGGGSFMTCHCRAHKLSCDAPTIRLHAGTEGVATFPESLSVTGNLWMAANTYFRYQSSSSRIEAIVGADGRGISIGSKVGTLHGTWTVDSTVITSDRKLKKDIKPLQDTLRTIALEAAAKQDKKSPEDERTTPAQWIIAMLRPVSYEYLAHAGRRYGFVANEVEDVLPDLVRTEEGEDGEPLRKLILMDFIPLLVSAMQGQQGMIEELGRRGDSTEQRLLTLEKEHSWHKSRLADVWTELLHLKDQRGDKIVT